MWGWLIVGGVLLWVPVLMVLWCLLVMAGRGEDEEMKDHRLKNNKDHRLEACATKQT